MEPRNYNEHAVHRLFDDALKRASNDIPDRATIDAIMVKAHGIFHAAIRQNNRMTAEGRSDRMSIPNIVSLDSSLSLEGANTDIKATLNDYRPDPSLTSMPPREFVGPSVGTAKFFPKNAISLFTALGGAGKTTTLLNIAACIAGQREGEWQDIRGGKVIMFFVEEDQVELNRKFGAATHDWPQQQREKAADNLRLVSLVGQDPHLTARVAKGGVAITQLVSKVIDHAFSFNADLVVMDHLQGFADGDLNASDTATALAMAANMIVAKTGAAVVFTAHVNKGQINADTVDAGFTTGNLAFENAARQVTGVIKIPEKEAEGLGLLEADGYMKAVIAKNSYGPAREAMYLHREYVQDFHTVRVRPFKRVITTQTSSLVPRAQRLKMQIVDYVANQPGTTKNKLDTLSGKTGQFKASKNEVRRVVEELLDDKSLRVRTVSSEDKQQLGLPQQVNEILEVVK
jgi:RecA-family ATPase